MSFRNISAWAIRNPVAPIVLFVALTLAGLVAFNRMQVNLQPDVDFPAAIVTISQPGAAPSELETQVTQKVEAAVRGISGVDEINSTAREGSSTTVVQFAIGTPVDRVVNDVRDAVSNIRSDLPDGILEPQVQRLDVASGGPLAYFAVQSTAMTLEELSWYVDNTVAKKLLSIEGMAQVERGGGVDREIRVVLDPPRLQAFGVTASQVNAQLRAINQNAAGGRAEIAGSEQSVRVLGNARNAYDLSQTNIVVGGGRTVKLADLAQVTDGYAEQRKLSKMNGRQVLSFSFTKAKGASDVTVYDEAIKVLRQLEKEDGKVRFTQLSTTVDYTKAQYKSAMEAMLEGAVLAVLVVFLFLRDWRATLISALAIPLSAIPAFWFISMLGFTLNNLVLLALSLVAGVLVDDAIVEIENIVRHMRMGKTAYQASIDAADEIGLAVLATTMSIVAVFLPVGLMPGISGQFFKNFGLTVVVSVLMSLAVARLITPLIAAYFLKSHGHAEHGEGWLMDKYMAVLGWSLDERKMDAARARGSGRVMSRLRDHRVWIVGLGGVALVMTILLFAGIPVTFQPASNTDYSTVRVEMTPGTTLRQTEAVTDKVRELLASAPEVENAFSSIQVGSANIYLTLKPKRDMTSVEFERSWAGRLNQIADARVTFQSQNNGGPGSSGRDITITLGGDDPAALLRAGNILVEQMKTLPELRAPRTGADLVRPEVTIKPRLDLAADLGVTTQALSQTIRIATLGDIDQNSAKFSLSDRQIPIRTQLSEDSRRSLSTIENLPVPTASGASVPLKVVADVSFGSGPVTIQRTNQIRRLTIGVDLAPGLVDGDVMPKINNLPIMKNLPQGVTKLNLGAAKWQAELFVNFIVAVISGVFLVFAVLVLLYKRVLPPFVNMGSLLLAPLGAAMALRLTGTPVSMPVFIGLLMLLGIVAKNSILLVDFALEEMNKGVDTHAAIMDAGHKRAQPIVMTTIAMVAGMVPVALSLSGDGSQRAPMGVVVIGGLIVSTVLTLLIVPATFSLAVGVERWLGPRLSRWLTNGGEGAPKPVTQPAE